MNEYIALIYKNSRTKGFIANCMMKNLLGFGKTEEEAIYNLKISLEKFGSVEVEIKPMYKLSLA